MLSLLRGSPTAWPYFLPDVGEAVVRAAVTLEPDIIVASGDFTQRAKPPEYEAAHNFLARLPPVPLVVTPGNHDIPLYRVMERLFTPYDLYRQHISQELDTVLRHPAASSHDQSTSPLRVTSGRIRPGSSTCDAAFAEATEKRCESLSLTTSPR
jgi:3',5'-cyclic AMP phosphodiesterase CpdA